MLGIHGVGLSGAGVCGVGMQRRGGCRARALGGSSTARHPPFPAGYGKGTRQKVLPAPADERVAANVRRFRKTRGLKATQLSERVTALGRPIPETSIIKIEAGKRRVDAGDIVALALEVTPNLLLLTGDAGEPVEVTEGATVPAEHAWQWAEGERPLAKWNDNHVVAGGLFDTPEDGFTLEDLLSWFKQANPHRSETEAFERTVQAKPGARLHVENQREGER